MGRRAATGDVAGQDAGLAVARERDPPVAARAGRVPYRTGPDARCPSEPPGWRLPIRVRGCSVPLAFQCLRVTPGNMV